MNKKGLFKSFLICTIAALSFSACGKKKNNTTTKDNTTTVAPEPDPEPKQDEVKTSSYYAKANNGIAALEVRTKKDVIQFVSFSATDNEGMPTLLQPIIENNQITKVKLYAFMSTDGSPLFFIRTIDLKDDGIELPLEIEADDLEYSDSNTLFLKKDNGKLCIYNRNMNVTFDTKGNVTTNDFITATTAPYILDGIVINYKDGVYSIAKESERIECCLDPANFNLTLSRYSNYLKKFVKVGIYKMDITSTNPTCQLLADPSLMSDESEDIFYEPVLKPYGTLTPTLDENGNVTSCKAVMSMYGMEDESTSTLVYNDNNQLVSVTYEDEGITYQYQYTYDVKGRIKTFKKGKIESNTFTAIEEYEYTYTDFGYKQIIKYNDGSEKYQQINSYDENKNYRLTSTQVQRYIGSAYANYYLDTFTYNEETGLLAESKKEYATPSVDDSRTVYTYTDGIITNWKTYKKYDNSGTLTEYLYMDTTDSKEKKADNHYYKTTTEKTYNTNGNGNINNTRVVSYEYLDEESLYLLKYEDRTTYYDDSEHYIEETYVYSDETKLITSYTKKEKESRTSALIKETTRTYTYKGNVIDKITQVETNGSSTTTNMTYTYNTNGRISETLDNKTLARTVCTYDADLNPKQSDTYQFVNETVGELLVTTYKFTPDNPMMPNIIINRQYNNSTYKLEMVMQMYYADAMSLMAGTPSITTIQNYDANEKLSVETITEYYELSHTSSKTTNKTYAYNGETQYVSVETVLEYDEDGDMTKESYTERYNETNLKEVYEKVYGTETTGTRSTYTNTDPQVVTNYTWDTSTDDWKVVTE
ncbi:MAG: hypothetical protein K6E87_01755 [bacterium]|nr:hypothetical protein [bacterium]